MNQSATGISKTGLELPVMEHFYTLQGEGCYTGQAAYFVRIAGCDVGCVWCDVKESWPADTHPVLTVEQIVAFTKAAKGAIVVITGGEPAMHQLNPLTTALKSIGKRLHIETSGVYELSGTWDWVCFSPKKFKAPDPSIYLIANELKVVINHKSDFDFALQHAALVNPTCKLYLQAEWDKAEKMAPLLIDFIKDNPAWALSMQTHKYLQIP